MSLNLSQVLSGLVAVLRQAFPSTCAQAASSRGMEVEDMQQKAQGRVWSGEDALQQGLIDALGGVSRAVAIAKQAAGLSAPLHSPPPYAGICCFCVAPMSAVAGCITCLECLS